MIENLATWLGRRVHVRGVDRVIRTLYPMQHDATRYVHGIRTRRDTLQMELDSRTLIDWELLFHGEYEPELRLLFEKLLEPGSVAIDAGANVGAHTLTLARLVGQAGRVLAFEPNPPIQARLEHNVALNALPQVTVYGCALGADTAHLDLMVPASDSAEAANPGMASLVALDTPHDVVRVGVRRLDDIVVEAGLRRVDVIKIDVQGYESNVLEGARHTLERFHPAVIFEYEDWAWRKVGTTFLDAVHFLPAETYRYFSIVRAGRQPRLTPLEHLQGLDGHLNVLAIAGVDQRAAAVLHAFG